jgi:Arc/MetJ-type ribon-helix-helix transcriptional regulator
MSSVSLPPHLEQFVHQQIAAGYYLSESEVIRAALLVLAGTTIAQQAATPRGNNPTSAWLRSTRPPVEERWESPAEWLANSKAISEPSTSVKRSPRGLLADLRSGLDFEEVQEVRNELWLCLHPGGA